MGTIVNSEEFFVIKFSDGRFEPEDNEYVHLEIILDKLKRTAKLAKKFESRKFAELYIKWCRLKNCTVISSFDDDWKKSLEQEINLDIIEDIIC